MRSIIKNLPSIIEEGVGGTNNAWHYRKWSDGTAECWARITKRITPKQATAPWSGYIFDMGTSNYPTNLFVSAPTGTISGAIGTAYCVISYMQFYYNGISTILTSNASSAQDCVINVRAIGKWK